MTSESGQTLHEAMIAYLREHPEGVPPSDLASRFLMLKNPKNTLAAAAISTILSSDRRCSADSRGMWHAALLHSPESAETDPHLRSLPWCALYCLADPAGNRLLFCSAWDLVPSPSCVFSSWLVDPNTFPYEERVSLAGPATFLFDRLALPLFPETIIRLCRKRIPLFLSSHSRALLAFMCAARGRCLPDDTMVISELAKAARISLSRPLSLETVERSLFGSTQSGAGAMKQGERFAACAGELIDQVCRRGIESRAELDRFTQQEKEHYFSGKSFSSEDILSLPTGPGIYGFKDKDGAYLYIGKASNLKRRVMSYFRETDESPEKLAALRNRMHALVTHQCGSDLECLIQEYRLIQKHAPPLNTQTVINERKGSFKPVHDTIILLPHVQQDKGMSLWFREGQKIRLKSFDASFPDESSFISELHSFFFGPALPAVKFDFPEQEIAARWIRQERAVLVSVPVSRMANAREVFDALRFAWRDFQEAASSRERTLGFHSMGFGR